MVVAEEIVHVLSPLSPFAGRSVADSWKRQYSPEGLTAQFELAAKLADKNPYFGPVVTTKVAWFSDGVGIVGDYEGSPMREWHDQAKQAGFDLVKVCRDFFLEYIPCNNAAAVWFEPPGDQAVVPSIAILDCARCSYSDAYGLEELKIRVTKNDKLSDEQAELIGKKWAKAIRDGTSVVLKKDEEDHFFVVSDAKSGRGFAPPSLTQVISEFAVVDLLAVADWAGAYAHGDVFRLATKGHEIKQGDRAGFPDWFLTSVDQEAIRKAMKSKRGFSDMVANFDFALRYIFLDPKFFDPNKYKNTVAKIERWAGAAGVILTGGELKQGVLDVMRQESVLARSQAKRLLEGVLNDESFWPASVKPPTRLEICFNPHTFLQPKTLMEMMRLAHTNGWLSPQTARGVFGLDNKREGDLLAEAHKQPERFSPAFQSHQGAQQNQGGRPSDSESTQTPPPTIV